MDQETKESVLNFLVRYYAQNGKHFDKGDKLLSQQLPQIQYHTLRAILQILKDEGLVSFNEHAGYFHHIEATPSGLDYFNQKEQTKSEKQENRKWDLKLAGLSFASGLVAGMTIQWFVYTYLRG